MKPTTYPDEVEQALADAAQRFGRERYDPAERHRLPPAQRRFDEVRWREMAELGWLAVASDEADGGLGLRVGAVAILARAAGAAGINEPLVSSGAVAADVIRLHASDAQRARWVEPLVQGHLRAACTFAEGAWPVRVEGTRLVGGREVVPDADLAGLLLIECEHAGALRWFAVPAGTPGLRVRSYPLVDGRIAATLEFEACEAEPLPVAALPHSALLAALAACADAVGAMETAFALTLEHIKTRRQFGAPLAANQVVVHRAVDMYLRLQESRAVLAQAVAALEGGDGAGAVHAAKAFVGPQARLLAQDAVQLHGGIGITEECGASHCLRRILVDEHLYGSPSRHLRRFMDHQTGKTT